MKKAVNIIGKGKGYNQAPSHIESWGVNDIVNKIKLDKVISLHRNMSKKISTRCNKINCQVIGLHNDVEVKRINNYIKFPYENVIYALKCDILESSIDYLIAYAIYLGYTEINIYGVTFGTVYEYKFQKDSLEYWIGYAMGRGITVNINGESNMFKLNGNKPYPLNNKIMKLDKTISIDGYDCDRLLEVLYTFKKIDDEIIIKLYKIRNIEVTKETETPINFTANECKIIFMYLKELNNGGFLSKDYKKLYNAFVS